MLKYISTVHSLSFFREVTNQFGMGKGLKLMNFSLSLFFILLYFVQNTIIINLFVLLNFKPQFKGFG